MKKRVMLARTALVAIFGVVLLPLGARDFLSEAHADCPQGECCGRPVSHNCCAFIDCDCVCGCGALSTIPTSPDIVCQGWEGDADCMAPTGGKGNVCCVFYGCENDCPSSCNTTWLKNKVKKLWQSTGVQCQFTAL